MGTKDESIEIRFYELWDKIDILEVYPKPWALWVELFKHYSEGWRTYHNLDHIRFGLTQFDLLEEYPPWLEFAYYYHDIIYDTDPKESSFNESRSALMAMGALAHADLFEVQDNVSQSIMATEHKHPPKSIEQQVIVDIDLATLGLPEEQFLMYQQKVRSEYAMVPSSTFWVAHAKVLKKFLERDNVYYTWFFQEMYEKQARENIEMTLRRYGS